MAIFNSYVSLPEGNPSRDKFFLTTQSYYTTRLGHGVAAPLAQPWQHRNWLSGGSRVVSKAQALDAQTTPCLCRVKQLCTIGIGGEPRDYEHNPTKFIIKSTFKDLF